MAFNDYMQLIYPTEDMTWEEFDSIFSPILNNCERLWNILEEQHNVNIYEVFISLIIFVQNSEFEDKLFTIFKAFDTDGDGSLDRKELSKFLICGT